MEVVEVSLQSLPSKKRNDRRAAVFVTYQSTKKQAPSTFINYDHYVARLGQSCTHASNPTR